MALTNVAIVGLGVMGRHHLRILRGCPDVEVVALVDPHVDGPITIDGVPIYSTLESAISIGLDACIVATPTETHASIACRLANVGVAALIEKPLAADMPSGRTVVATFAKHGVVAAVAHVERFNPAVLAMRDRLARRELGEVFQFASTRQGPLAGRVRDIGVVKDLAIHDLDLAQFLTGSRYAGLAARTARRSGGPHEDFVSIVGWLEDGTVTNHLVNRLSPIRDRRVVAVGELGCLVADLLTSDLMFSPTAAILDADGLATVTVGGNAMVGGDPQAVTEPLAIQMEQFLRAVRGEPHNSVTLQEGLDALGLAELTLESAATGEVVHTVLH